MSFCTYQSHVVLCSNEEVIVYNLENDRTSKLQLPELETERKIGLHNNVDVESLHTLTAVEFSKDGQLFLVCTNRKQLCLYEAESLKLLSNRVLARAASRVRFAPNNDVIVADKAGDVYLYRRNNPGEGGLLILGHLSMILDVLVPENGNYILTADRDEKIRVSLFPNSYNILSYCLGHKKFVTNMTVLPDEQTILVSAGGDGSFKLWDYVNGKELLSVNFNERIPRKEMERLKKQLQDYHLEESVDSMPVKHLRTCCQNGKCLVIMSFYSSSVLLVYNVEGSMHTGFQGTFVQSLLLESEPVECNIENAKLWVLTGSGLEVFDFRENSFSPNDTLCSKLGRLNAFWEKLKTNTLKHDLFPVLYKRKYDNVHEYLERKKLRLGAAVAPVI